MSETRSNPLGTEKVGKLMLKFSIPAVISMVVSSLYSIVDQIFIGRGVGMLGNGATNVAFPLTTICVALGLLIGIGTASNYNLRCGEGKEEEAKYYMGNGLFWSILFGVIIMILVQIFLHPLLIAFGATDSLMPYASAYSGIVAWGIPFYIIQTGGCHMIRADRNPQFSMICVVVGAAINVVLDPLFIFAFGWGIKGAAWATVLGQMVSGILVLVYYAKMSNVELAKEHFMPKGNILGKISALGSASCINQIALMAFIIVMNNVLRTYGEQSIYGAEIPLAAVGIVSKVFMVFLSLCIGTSQGCQPIFGFNYGAKKYERVQEAYKKACTICVVIGIIFFLAFEFMPRPIISMFGEGSDLYFQFAVRYLRIYMALTFVNGIQPLCSNFFTSMGKAKLGIIISLTRQILLLIPLVLILPKFMGIEGVLYSGPIADGGAAFLAILFAALQFKDMNMHKQSPDSKA